MGLYQALTELEYPESDGRPMGETDLHPTGFHTLPAGPGLARRALADARGSDRESG